MSATLCLVVEKSNPSRPLLVSRENVTSNRILILADRPQSEFMRMDLRKAISEYFEKEKGSLRSNPLPEIESEEGTEEEASEEVELAPKVSRPDFDSMSAGEIRHWAETNEVFSAWAETVEFKIHPRSGKEKALTEITEAWKEFINRDLSE